MLQRMQWLELALRVGAVTVAFLVFPLVVDRPSTR
jgi:hypothetical protein